MKTHHLIEATSKPISFGIPLKTSCIFCLLEASQHQEPFSRVIFHLWISHFFYQMIKTPHELVSFPPSTSCLSGSGCSICYPGKQFPLKAESDDAQGGKSTLDYQIKGHLLLLSYSRDWFLLKTQNWVTWNYIRCFSIWKLQHKQNLHFGCSKRHLKIQISYCLFYLCFLEFWAC